MTKNYLHISLLEHAAGMTVITLYFIVVLNISKIFCDISVRFAAEQMNSQSGILRDKFILHSHSIGRMEAERIECLLKR